jgi:hypothetical protein
VERACKKEQVFFHGKNASVYSMIVSLTEFWEFFTWTKICSILYLDSKKA